MVSSQSSNATDYGIKNDGERFTWGVLLALIFLASLFGDTTILVASIKYKAFRLHRIIVAFIQHIAICDLIISIATIFTQSVSLMANRWVFGSIMCYVKVYSAYYCNSANVLLICGMTVGKLLMLQFPLRARSWTRRQVHGICTGLCTMSLCGPVMFLIIDKDDVKIFGIDYTCGYGFSSDSWRYLKPITFVLFAVIPITMLIAASILIIVKAKTVVNRTQESIRWQGITTVILTAAVYFFSFLPLAVHLVIKSDVKDEAYKAFAPRIVETLNYVNVGANFFIYSLTVNSFRLFLAARIEMVISCLPSFKQNTGNEDNISKLHISTFLSLVDSNSVEITNNIQIKRCVFLMKFHSHKSVIADSDVLTK